MKHVFILLALMVVMACSSGDSPSNEAPVITSFTAQPKLIRTCPIQPCSEGYYSVLNCVAADPDSEVLFYSFRTEPTGAGVNQPDPNNGIGIFEATQAGEYAVVCRVCDNAFQTGKCVTEGIYIKVCDTCNL